MEHKNPHATHVLGPQTSRLEEKLLSSFTKISTASALCVCVSRVCVSSVCVSAVCVVCVVFCCVACLVARLGPLTNSYAAFKKYFFHLQLRSELGLNREMVPMVTHPGRRSWRRSQVKVCQVAASLFARIFLF